MSWYKTGTITATNNSKIITGAGTQFTNPLNVVSAGRMLLLPAAGTVQIYEIESVQSDTQLTLVSAFSGATGSGKPYAIPTSPSVSIEQFAHEFASTLAYYQQQLQGWQSILTGTGNITLTTPDGQTVTVRSQAEWDRLLNTKIATGQFGVGGVNDLRSSPLIGLPSAIYGKGTIFGLCNGDAIGLPGHPLVTLILNGSWNDSTGWASINRIAIGDGGVLIQQAVSDNTWGNWVTSWNNSNLPNPMKKGEFGWGGRTQLIIDANHETFFNALTPSGVYAIAGSQGITKLPVDNGMIDWKVVIASSGQVFGVLKATSYFGASIGNSYTRIYSSAAGWSEWAIGWDNKTLTNPSVYGAGIRNAPLINNIYDITQGSGFFRSIPGTSDSPPDSNPFAALFNSSYAADNTGTIAINVLTGTMWHTGLANGAKRPWRKVYDTGNTTVGSGGALLVASPVINIYADGSFTTTDEAAGVDVERLSEGVYKITGCQGMNADPAWNGIDGGIKNPVCRNDKTLLWNNYEVDEDGSVTVYTFHRVHLDAMPFAQNRLTLDKEPFDPKKGHALEDTWPDQTPIDVPRGLFIQVRVNMPERIEQKPTIMSSNVYCNTISPA
ncbi:hypothetical protein CUU54_01500 [Pectobacterium polaris]|uniref:phage tail fiber protein n=1 Tax=Pectobacterium polaris TaxID=2042057 RepID=UPI000D61D371|nr:hypothetical protein [Pectobacterium polaris]MCU1787530.1 hypothetical protein [Pectobacterium polaris]PWD55845.1 hypothetical protein DF209_18230 [Pectobacterium polaris]